jgi:hypothetical protein
MNKYILFIILSFASYCVQGQDERAQLRGVLVDKMSRQPIPNAQLLIPQLKILFTSAADGQFVIQAIPYGTYNIYVRNELAEVLDSFNVVLRQAYVALDTIAISQSIKDSLVLTVYEPEQEPAVEEDGILLSSSTSALLQASGTNEPFLNALSFVFSGVQFQPRANRKGQQVWLNGIMMKDVLNDQTNWSTWSGLNDLLKNPSISYGLIAAQNAYGGLNGNLAFECAPLEQSKQMKFAYGIANKSYQHKIVFSYHSGLRAHQSAWSISVSRRWADESYVPGTFFNAFSVGASWAKIIRQRHQISLHLIAAPSQRGRSGTATDEVYRLAKNKFYNANWGWQANQKRNARVISTQMPMLQAQHFWTINQKAQIKSSFLCQIGCIARQGLDWYQAQDPRPDYYRNLPSYYVASFPNIASELQDEIARNPNLLQIDWDRLYAANLSHSDSIIDGNGIIGNTIRGNRALYVLASDVERSRKIAVASNGQFKLNEHLFLSSGIQYSLQHVEYFKRVDDLLGADFFVNTNQFAAQQFVANNTMKQYDLLQPNRAVKEGALYAYHYQVNAHQAFAWSQLEVDTRKLHLFVAAEMNGISYQRIGLYQNGLFPNASLGKSAVVSFMQGSTKIGIQYKINGRNYLYAHCLYGSQEPGFNQVFISARIRNQTLDTLQQAHIASFEWGYFLKAPKLTIRLSCYATDITKNTVTQRFYNDDPAFQTYVNFVQQHLNTRSIGLEWGVSYAISSLWSVQAAAAIGQSFYTNNPKVVVFSDNDTNVHPIAQSVFIQNYYQGVGPQSVYTLGATYNSKRFWFIKANANCADRNYVAINPGRRSIAAAELIDRASPEFAAIFNQEKLPTVINIQLVGGKSIRLHKIFPQMKYTTTMYVSAGINNLLPQRADKLMGYEQLRYDFVNNNPNKFPNKYVYGTGTTFFIQASLKL